MAESERTLVTFPETDDSSPSQFWNQKEAGIFGYG